MVPGSIGPRQGETGGEAVYRTRRPALAGLFAIGAVLFELPALRLFARGAFGSPVSSTALVSSTFLIIGLPLFALGLYALSAGGGRVSDQQTARAWLRPPVAYLTVGLVLLVAAGLAAG